jgi:hypothetical protein
VFHLKTSAAQLGGQGVGEHGIVFGKQQFHARSLMDCSVFGLQIGKFGLRV